MKTALALDFGTTKVAAVIVDETKTLLAASSGAHHAEIHLPRGGEEEDTAKILTCAAAQIAALPAELRAGIAAVGLTGQMHSVLTLADGTPSALTTWQDHRCGETRLRHFQSLSGHPLREGFGGTTLARLAGKNPLTGVMRAAAIADYAGSLLCGNSGIITDPTHAASWGLYDAEKGDWDFKALEALRIPAAVMPRIAPSGSIIGSITPAMAQKLGLPAGIPVVNGIGDNQASIIGTGNVFSEEIYLTLGTGAQLSIVVDKAPAQLPEMLEIRPFPGNRSLIVAAPLCGGSAFAFLADTVNHFRRALGEPEWERGKLLDKLDALALAELQKGSLEISASPHFLGERHDPALRGAFYGLTLTNATPGKLAAALAEGIIENLQSGFDPALFANRKRVIGSGNAVRLLKSIQYGIEKHFQLPLELSSAREEAAVGAAVLALQSFEPR